MTKCIYGHEHESAYWAAACSLGDEAYKKAQAIARVESAMNARESVLSGVARELRQLADYLERYPRDASSRIGDLVSLVEKYEKMVRGPTFKNNA